jgi:hypothetical protein
MLCSEYRFTTVIIDKPTGHQRLRYRITSKDSTDTFIEQVQFRFFWKGSQKANCLSVYTNEQSDKTFSPPFEWQSTSARDLQPTRSVMMPAQTHCYSLDMTGLGRYS